MNLHQFLQYRGYKPKIFGLWNKEGIDWTFDEALDQELETIYNAYLFRYPGDVDDEDDYLTYLFSSLTLCGAKSRLEQDVIWTRNLVGNWCGEYRGRNWYLIKQEVLHP